MATNQMEFLEITGNADKYSFIPVLASTSQVGGVKATTTTDAKYIDEAKLKSDDKLYARTDKTLLLDGVAADAAAVGALAEYLEYTANGDPIVTGSKDNFTDTYYHNAAGTHTDDHGVQYRFFCQPLDQGAYYIYQNQEWTAKISNVRLFEVTGNWEVPASSTWVQVWVTGDLRKEFQCPTKAGVTYVLQMSYHIFAGGTYPILWKATTKKKLLSEKMREIVLGSDKLLKGYWGPNLAACTSSTVRSALGVNSTTESYLFDRVKLEPGATYLLEQQKDNTINNYARCFRRVSATDDTLAEGPQLWGSYVKTILIKVPEDGVYRTLQVCKNITNGKKGNSPSLRKWISTDSLTNEIIEKRINILDRTVKPKLRVLIMGNSYSLDSWSYVPAILKERGIDIDLSIYYRGGGTLQLILDEWESTTSHAFYHWDTTVNSRWLSYGAVRPYDVLGLGGWDLVISQQSSVGCTEADSFNCYPTLLNLIQNYLKKGAIHGWMIAYTRGEADYISTTLANQKAFYDKYPFGMAFPAGTSVFNARTNATLAAVGSGGNLWYSDQVHLEEGLPCYVAACGVAEAIFRKFYPRECILGDTVRPTWDKITEWAVYGKHGTAAVGVTEENVKLAHKAAILANNNPWAVTNMA